MSNLIDNRQIRVFISSTFQDMQDERNYLIQKTFPILRRKAAKRDVMLTEIDLRWGITPEESESGKVVEICLREIENSIPFFVGIIGDRYGWVPSDKDLTKNTKERFPKVKKYLERRLSVTEMEMQFGVLARKEDMHAYFYIKEETASAEIDNPEMLKRLKTEVRKSKYPSSTYTSLEDLGSQVEQAFTALLDQIFPEGHLSQLEKERIGQRSFMHQLCQIYIPDDKNFKALDDWMGDWEQHQLVVTGASGLGKSALIANWTNKKLQDANRNYNIICHFTGNGGNQSSHEHIMKVLADEIRDVYGWDVDEYQNLDDIKLENLFIKVASEGDKPLLIILDAVNQIVDLDNAKLMNWLPVPPRNIKILFSTLEDDRTMKVFRNRHYPVFTLNPLSVENRYLLAKKYLHKQYGKKLTDEQITRIITDSQCENTMILKTLLDELINFGIHEKLDERIDYYLAAETINDFYQKLLESYEEEYREYGDNFAKKILSLIAISRNGLSEEEIISIADIKPLHWSQFYCRFYSNMNNKNGLITFAHVYVQNAIDNRYHEEKHSFQNKICSYFENNESRHSLSELPYQYFNMRNENALYSFLENPQNFMFLYQFCRYELKKYWIFLLNSCNRSFCAYIKNNDIVSKDIYFCKALTSFYCNEICYDSSFGFEGNPAISAYFAKKMLSKDIDVNDKIYSLRIYVASLNYALKTYRFGSKDCMEIIIDEKIKTAICELSNLLTNLNIINSEKSAAYKVLGQYHLTNKRPIEGFEFLSKSLDYAYSDSIEYYNTQIILSNIEIRNNELDSARQRLFKIINEITLRFSYFSIINAQALTSLSWLYEKKGDYNDSINCMLDIIKIYDFLLDNSDVLYESVYSRLSRLYGLIDDEELSNYYRDKFFEFCWRTVDNPDGRHHRPFRLDRLDRLEYIHRDYNIEEWAKTSLNIYLEVYGDNNIETAESYNNLAVILGSNGQFDQAEELINKAIKIAKCNNFKTSFLFETDFLLLFTFNKAYLFMLQHNYDNAIHEFNSFIEKVKEPPYSSEIDVDTSYNCLGDIYLEKESFDKSLESYRCGLEFNKEKSNPVGICESLYKIGLVYFKMQKNNVASRLFKKTALLVEKNVYLFEGLYNLYVDCIIHLCKLKLICHKPKEAELIYNRAYKKITELQLKNKLKKEYNNLLLQATKN